MLPFLSISSKVGHVSYETPFKDVLVLHPAAFGACLSVSLTTDDPEGEFVSLMFAIQLAAFLLLPVAVALSYCITNYIR